MIIRKFSKCSVDVKNQLFRSYVSCLYCCALWKDYSTSSFNMLRVAYNNVYRALMGIKKVYGHSISSEYVNNCIDGFEANSEKINFQSERSPVYELKHHYCSLHIITVFYVCQPFVCEMES